jgi:hypothetical protein
MAKKAPSAALRARLRARIIDRIAELNLKDFEAAEELGLSPGQMSRLRAREDVFTLDRLDRCRRKHRDHGAHERDAAISSRLENPYLACRRRMMNPEHRTIIPAAVRR